MISTETNLHLIERRLARIEQALSALEQTHAYGFVYIVGDNQGRYKIGASQDIQKRMSDMTATNTQLDLVLTIRTDNHYTLEKALHTLYRRAHRHIIREWYALAQPDIDALTELPQPLYVESLPGVLATVSSVARRPIAKATTSTNNRKHPSFEEAHRLKQTSEAARAAEMFMAGKTPAEIVYELRGVKSHKGGRKYQKALTEILNLIREGERRSPHTKTLPKIPATAPNIARKPIIKPATPTSNGKHPSTEEAHRLKQISEAVCAGNMFMAGKDPAAIVWELRQVSSKASGSKYQKALAEVLELIRQGVR